MNDIRTTSFTVAEVEPSSVILNEQWITENYGDRLLGCPQRLSPYVEGSLTNNPLLVAAHQAFLKHYPLVLSPDVIWLTLLQGLSQHIESNAETLRHHFVAFPGKFSLKITSEGGVNPWPEAIDEFSQQIQRYLKPDAYQLILSDFSTTDVNARIASEVMLMAAMKSYFDYEAFCICGIPSVTLAGTTEDWQNLRSKAQRLGRYDLTHWSEQLEPILAQFVQASQGRVDPVFWNDLYQFHPDPSSTAYENRNSFSGWIGLLFPYLDDGSVNPMLGGEAAERYQNGANGLAGQDLFDGPGLFDDPPASRSGGLFDEPSPNVSTGELYDTPSSAPSPSLGKFPGLTIDRFPRGLAGAPVKWGSQKVSFYGGLLGAVQARADKALKPYPGWLVLRD